MGCLRAYHLVPVVLALGLAHADRPDVDALASPRGPVELTVLPDGKRALVANQTAGTVSLVDLQAGKVLHELAVGKRPSAVACSPDGRSAAVSNLWSHSIALLEVSGARLAHVADISDVGFPRGLVFSADGQSLFAALAGDDVIATIDWSKRAVTRRVPAPREPRQLALSHDGRLLAAGSSRSGQVRCWDVASGRLHREATIADAFNLRGIAFTPEDRFLLCAHVVRREFPVTKANIEKGWVIDSRVTRLAVTPARAPDSWQIALDTRGQAVGDPHGLALGDAAKVLAIAAGGTHELLLLTAAAIPWTPGDPGDLIDPHLRKQLRRIELGGRPMTLTFSPVERHHAVVANYLLDAIQVVDTRAARLVKTIPLGEPIKPTPARRGEAIFHDARRSHNQWFSCHTCHVDGHTCCLSFDTLNDDSYGNPKLTPSLHNVAGTGPWTWHGIQKDLSAGARKSLTQTMFGPAPSPADVADLVAFLKTLTPPPHPRPGKSAAEKRGKELFHGKAGCAACHRPPLYTSPASYDIKLGDDGSPYRLWNPPSLLGLYDRGPFLHDGRARTLDDLLRFHHTPAMLRGEQLTDRERGDLIAFLKSL